MAVRMANGGGGTEVFGVRDRVVGRADALLGVPAEIDIKEALIKSRSSRRDAVGARFFNVAKRAEQCLASIDLLPDRGRVLCLCALAPGAPWALQANRARLARTRFAKANRVCSWATFFSRPL